MRARTTREDADVRIDATNGARKWVAHRVDEEPVLVDDVGTEEGGALEGLARKLDARNAIHLKMEKPAPDLAQTSRSPAGE